MKVACLFCCVFAVTGLSACGGDDNGGGGGGGTDAGGTAGTGGGGTGGSTGGTGGGGSGGTGGATGGSGGTTGGTGGSTGGTGGVVTDGGSDATTDGGLDATTDAVEGGGDGATSACAALQACCDALDPGTGQNACNAQAAAGIDASCNTAMVLFCTDAGVAVSMDAGTNCADLAACCSQLSGPQQTQCNDVVDAGLNQSCAALYNAYVTLGTCTP